MKFLITPFLCFIFIFDLNSQPVDHPIPDTEIIKDSQQEWREDLIPKIFPEIQIIDELDPKKSEKYLKSSKNYYDLAMQILEDLENEKNKLEEKFKHLPENYEWQRIEKKEKIEKQKRAISLEYFQKAKIYIIKGLKELENIQSEKVKNTEYFINLKSNLLRQFVILQLSLKDISGVIESIEEYFNIKKIHKEEPYPYKILAYCYQILENSSKNNQTSYDVALRYKKLKFENLLLYVEKKYGRDSNEYKIFKEKIKYDL